ncbi:hypothetical protein Fmac_011053 [Flemingia macrophylla]|uniref:Uncharacterized protein n=1 Tax=Flemingia macrophylla TaxID=520843 RepID=A0ABD1MLC8_9FABA
MGDSSFLGNQLEGQGQNVLEREDEKVKGRSVSGLIEHGHKVSRDCISENNVEKKPLFNGRRLLDSIPRGSIARKLVNRDDENYVKCTQLNSKNKICVAQPDTPIVKDATPFMSDENSRDSSELENLQRMYPFKKRKFFKQTSSSTSDRGSQCQGMQSTSLMLQQGTYNVTQERSMIKIESCAEGDLNVFSSMEANTSTNNNMSKCRTLVAVPTINMEALTMVPFRRKSRNPDFAQRRIRRPFSVLEVEALVQAVEKLGTGRWRDVKQRAFDNAKHRTYVDLKDKWKTLVHTARISPQQRRGEPVPQELLDRVLAAHAYWSQQQCKHQLKPL